MTKEQAKQIARMINTIFYYETSVHPKTVALVFEYIGRMSLEDEDKYDETTL